MLHYIRKGHIMDRFESSTGKGYTICPHGSGSGWLATRTDTGSTVKISASIVNRTRDSLLAGGSLEWRTISYTVAIEQSVLHILRQEFKIKSNTADRTYYI